VSENSPGDAAAFLRERLPRAPEILGVLGSGLGALADAVEDPVSIPFGEIPGLPVSGVEGHPGRYVAGMLEGRSVLIQAGRFHLYEGYEPELVVAPIRIAAVLGVDTVVLSNAAGGVNPRFGPGTIMLIEDHLNLMARNPLVGPVAGDDARFPDMSGAYDPELRAHAEEAARELGVPLARGVYAGVLGPSYETPAEVRMLARLGADAVGMSTVPEVIAAHAGGLRVLAFSLITNLAAGLHPGPLSHREVLEVGRTAAATLERLIRGVLRTLPAPLRRSD
jgi:purine-nucleoside phosphorylase